MTYIILQKILGIAIGECIKKSINKFKGIKRYAHAMIPMDETLSRVAIDVSNRPYLIWKVNLKVEKLGEMDRNYLKNGSKHFLSQPALHFTWKIFMAITVTT